MHCLPFYFIYNNNSKHIIYTFEKKMRRLLVYSASNQPGSIHAIERPLVMAVLSRVRITANHIRSRTFQNEFMRILIKKVALGRHSQNGFCCEKHLLLWQI